MVYSQTQPLSPKRESRSSTPIRKTGLTRAGESKIPKTIAPGVRPFRSARVQWPAPARLFLTSIISSGACLGAPRAAPHLWLSRALPSAAASNMDLVGPRAAYLSRLAVRRRGHVVCDVTRVSLVRLPRSLRPHPAARAVREFARAAQSAVVVRLFNEDGDAVVSSFCCRRNSPFLRSPKRKDPAGPRPSLRREARRGRHTWLARGRAGERRGFPPGGRGKRGRRVRVARAAGASSPGASPSPASSAGAKCARGSYLARVWVSETLRGRAMSSPR